MSYRIVKINNRCKLETQLNYLVCRSDKETRILLDEISLLILENQQICMTEALLSQLMEHKVRVIFCDEKHNPQGEMVPYAPSFDSYGKIKQQIIWTKETNDEVWRRIVMQKIRNQALVLRHKGFSDAYHLLMTYCDSVLPDDSTNREGLSAKTYFATLFGDSFDRRRENDIRNTFLNYGYSLILSAINREIAGFGYLPQLGIHHIGETNPFNLGCDFMEPFRPFVDIEVADGRIHEETYKTDAMNILTKEVSFQERHMILENAIHDYVLSLLSALNGGTMAPLKDVTFFDEQL
jgi:CRISP-associated protein Cas1